jgi:hypothetical protein
MSMNGLAAETGSIAHGFSRGSRQTPKATRAPAENEPAIRRNASSGASKNMTPSREIAASNDISANG